MRNRKATLPDGVTKEITSYLAEWRKTHKAPTPFPQEIWTKAATLAAQYGVHPTARALGLGYATLRKHVAPAADGASLATFVEWLPPVAGAIAECALDVEARSGGHLRVVIKNVPASSLATIVREFCR